jgi:hypothetical protein
MPNQKIKFTILIITLLVVVNLPFFIDLNNSGRGNPIQYLVFGVVSIINLILTFLLISQASKIFPLWQAIWIFYMAFWIIVMFIFKSNLNIYKEGEINVLGNPIIWMLFVTLVSYLLLLLYNSKKKTK